MKTTIVLGAGFSKNSGIPVQAEIPGILFKNVENNEFDAAVTSVLRKFIEKVFGYDGHADYPDLDDILTCIDLSTNSGHHLGMDYSPSHLRAVRRFLIYRLFSILEKSFIHSDDMEAMIKRFSGIGEETGFVVLNWDTVLEKYFSIADPSRKINYCNGGLAWNPLREAVTGKPVGIAKIHGSYNWLYCDNCRNLFFDLENAFSLKEKAGFQPSDLELFEEFGSLKNKEDYLCSKKCRICGNPISSHIATFSYRKSFRANSFPDIWREAEQMLAGADRWVFIGYSLPDADYEFKHLLKIAELKLEHVKARKLCVDVVLFNSDATISKYRSFFGCRLDRVCNGGIKEYMDYIS